MNIPKDFQQKQTKGTKQSGNQFHAGSQPYSALRTPISALKLLHERLWHFTSVGMGNCRAAQRVRREIEQLRTAAVPGRSKVTVPGPEKTANGLTGRVAAPGDGRCPTRNPLANPSIAQLTAGLSHLESVGLANSCAAQIVRGELNRQLFIQSALILANADFDSNEPRDKDGRWTNEGDAGHDNTSPPGVPPLPKVGISPDQMTPEERQLNEEIDNDEAHPAAAIGKAFTWAGKALVAAAGDIGAELTGQSAQDDRDAKEAYQAAMDAANNDPAIQKKFQEARELYDNAKTGTDLEEAQKKWEEAANARDALADRKYEDSGSKPEPDNVAALLSGQQELPAESDLKVLPTPLRIAGRASQGALESTPKIGAVAALQAGGVPAPIAAGAIFGTTDQGFDPKQAVIAAVLPLVGKYTGEITAAMAARAGVSSDIALQAFNRMGGAAGVTAVIGTDQLQQIMKLPPDQRKQALIDAAASLGALFILGMLGAGKSDEGTGKYSSQVSQIQDVLSGKTEEAAYAPVSPDAAAKIKNATGRDVSGYQHLIDRDALIHIDRQHGVGREDQPDHEPVTKDDIEKIPQIVAQPDSVVDGGKSNRGWQTVKYSKRFNGTIYYVEEEWTQGKVLAAKTMYKVKAPGESATP